MAKAEQLIHFEISCNMCSCCFLYIFKNGNCPKKTTQHNRRQHNVNIFCDCYSILRSWEFKAESLLVIHFVTIGYHC